MIAGDKPSDLLAGIVRGGSTVPDRNNTVCSAERWLISVARFARLQCGNVGCSGNHIRDAWSFAALGVLAELGSS